MANTSTIDNTTKATDSVVDDHSKNPYEEPPSYTAVNPLLNNINLNTIQPQHVNTAPNAYCILKVNNPELNHIEDHMCWSVFNILCCCWILGCVACYFSCKTGGLMSKGNIQGALYASRNARTMNCVATILGIICYLIYVIYWMNYKA